MRLPLLLLLAAAGGTLASHFYGTVITHQPKRTAANGTVTVVLRYKNSFRLRGSSSWLCFGNCGTQTSQAPSHVYTESRSDWFQTEGVITREVPSGATFELVLSGRDWISNGKTRITSWRAVTRVDLRRRSDTGGPNASPLTTIIPALRVPSNCRRDYQLLAFDPDGDEVKCRYGLQTECNPCNQLSVAALLPSCTLSFNTSGTSDQGTYVVQLVMEDFPTRNITLNQTTPVSTNTAISKIPVQFALWVDAVVPSCTEGVYLPRFLPPTPAHKTRLNVSVNRTLEIRVAAEANTTTVSELLFSGPHDTTVNRTAAGRYVLRWTPTDSEDGETHAFCFIAQALLNSVKYQSDLRCVTVTVGLNVVIGLSASIASSFPLSDDNIRETVLKNLEAELERRGVPANGTMHLISSVRRPRSSPATPSGG